MRFYPTLCVYKISGEPAAGGFDGDQKARRLDLKNDAFSRVLNHRDDSARKAALGIVSCNNIIYIIINYNYNYS